MKKQNSLRLKWITGLESVFSPSFQHFIVVHTKKCLNTLDLLWGFWSLDIHALKTFASCSAQEDMYISFLYYPLVTEDFWKRNHVTSYDVPLHTIFCSTTVVLEKRNFHISSGSMYIFHKFRSKLILTAEVLLIKASNPNGMRQWFCKICFAKN